MVGSWSKYPGSKVGSVIVDQKKRIVSVGFNGYPVGVADTFSEERDERLRRVIHAEENSLLFANRDLEGCTMYVTHHPCARCAAKIIQVGIKKIVVDASVNDTFAKKWEAELGTAMSMFEEAGVNVQFV